MSNDNHKPAAFPWGLFLLIILVAAGVFFHEDIAARVTDIFGDVQ